MHTRTHTFNLSSSEMFNLQKYLHQLIVTHVPSIMNSVLKRLQKIPNKQTNEQSKQTTKVLGFEKKQTKRKQQQQLIIDQV